MPYVGDPDLLKTAVNSVLAQSDPGWTLCVVEDGHAGRRRRAVGSRPARPARHPRPQRDDVGCSTPTSSDASTSRRDARRLPGLLTTCSTTTTVAVVRRTSACGPGPAPSCRALRSSTGTDGRVDPLADRIKRRLAPRATRVDVVRRRGAGRLPAARELDVLPRRSAGAESTSRGSASGRISPWHWTSPFSSTSCSTTGWWRRRRRWCSATDDTRTALRRRRRGQRTFRRGGPALRRARVTAASRAAGPAPHAPPGCASPHDCTPRPSSPPRSERVRAGWPRGCCGGGAGMTRGACLVGDVRGRLRGGHPGPAGLGTGGPSVPRQRRARPRLPCLRGRGRRVATRLRAARARAGRPDHRPRRRGGRGPTDLQLAQRTRPTTTATVSGASTTGTSSWRVRRPATTRRSTG